MFYTIAFHSELRPRSCIGSLVIVVKLQSTTNYICKTPRYRTLPKQKTVTHLVNRFPVIVEFKVHCNLHKSLPLDNIIILSNESKCAILPFNVTTPLMPMSLKRSLVAYEFHVSRLVETFLTFYGKWNFIPVFTKSADNHNVEPNESNPHTLKSELTRGWSWTQIKVLPKLRIHGVLMSYTALWRHNWAQRLLFVIYTALNGQTELPLVPDCDGLDSAAICWTQWRYVLPICVWFGPSSLLSRNHFEDGNKLFLSASQMLWIDLTCR